MGSRWGDSTQVYKPGAVAGRLCQSRRDWLGEVGGPEGSSGQRGEGEPSREVELGGDVGEEWSWERSQAPGCVGRLYLGCAC